MPGATASQDWRLQRTVEQAFVEWTEADKIALRKRFEVCCEQHGVKEVAKVLKNLSFRSKGSVTEREAEKPKSESCRKGLLRRFRVNS